MLPNVRKFRQFPAKYPRNFLQACRQAQSNLSLAFREVFHARSYAVAMARTTAAEQQRNSSETPPRQVRRKYRLYLILIMV